MSTIEKDTSIYEDEESFRDKIATVDEKGKRIWVFPKKPEGRYFNARTGLSIALLAFLFAGPFIRIGGEPLLMLNVLERKFIIFGQIFWPQDFHLFVLIAIASLVFIILFTVIYGRIFCGWVCPQTIFMEMVFRKIEYWIEGDWKEQKKLDKAPWTTEKILKKGSKQIIFFNISFLISNTFLAYIIGSDELLRIITDPPSEHLTGLVAILLFTTAFYLVFSQLREQVCTTICPYGRLQGVLLDRKSLVVAYDYKRGEKRGKMKRGQDREALGMGDCISCKQCEYVCPTGIDIKNGTQLECINCTACIDACDSVMDRIGKPKGLIRYASEEEITKGEKLKFFNARAIAYTAVLFILLSVITGLLLTRTSVETTILRTPGMLYQDQPDGRISNLYSLKIINKTNYALALDLRIESGMDNAEIKLVGNALNLERQGILEQAMFIITEKSSLNKMNTPVKIGIYDQDGKLLETVKTSFLGPS